MKKETYIKRITTFLLTIIMFSSCFIPTIAYAEEQNVDAEEAKYLAFACVWDVQSCTDYFDKEIYYSDVFALYDSNLNPSAYVVNFIDENDNPNGYIVVAATSDNPEIIEFSNEGLSPYEEQYMDVEQSCEEKIYPFYEGNVSPSCLDKSGENFVEKKNGKLNKTKMKEKKASLKYSVANRKYKANSVKQMVIASGGASSNLTGSDFPLYNPYNYESGYRLWKSESVDNYEDLPFLTYNDYPALEEICGPIASTNLMIYWKNREPDEFVRLMRYDATWDTTFEILCDMMHFFNTTWIVNLANGIETFMDNNSSNGVTVTWDSPSSNGWNTVVREIGTYEYPIILLLQNHVEYGNHYVVAFKYLSFEYNDGTISNYVQICDGWSSVPNRYINFTKGFDSGSIYIVTIHPN